MGASCVMPMVRRNSPMRAWSVLSLAVIVLPGFAGCGGGGPAVETVTGVVLLDGKPVDGATVSFVPAGGGMFASGLTAADGTFTLSTAAPGATPGAGAVAGEYAVTIMKMASTEAAKTDDPNDPNYDPLASVSENPDRPTKSNYLVPRDYGNATTSGLKATVAKGRNELKFELDSKFKGG